MRDITVIILVIGLVALARTWLKTKTSPESSRRLAIVSLLAGFTLFVGISSVFADALFEFLGLDKPQHFEIFSLIAYVIFAVAIVFIFKNGQNTADDKDSKDKDKRGGIKIISRIAKKSKIIGFIGEKVDNVNLQISSWFLVDSEITGVKKIEDKTEEENSEQMDESKKEIE